jgi:peptide subunit release factor 1 (eRF1)
LIPIYQQASTYRNLLKEGIVGSPDRQPLNELHSSAWKIVEPIFTRSQQEAIDRFKELHGQQNGLATDDLDTAVKAAIGGRVETLLVPIGVQSWGRYDPATDSVHFDPEPTPENEDMVNYTAVQTILNSGNVYALPREQFPTEKEVAAILRYVI